MDPNLNVRQFVQESMIQMPIKIDISIDQPKPQLPLETTFT